MRSPGVSLRLVRGMDIQRVAALLREEFLVVREEICDGCLEGDRRAPARFRVGERGCFMQRGQCRRRGRGCSRRVAKRMAAGKRIFLMGSNFFPLLRSFPPAFCSRSRSPFPVPARLMRYGAQEVETLRGKVFDLSYSLGCV